MFVEYYRNGNGHFFRIGFNFNIPPYSTENSYRSPQEDKRDNVFYTTRLKCNQTDKKLCKRKLCLKVDLYNIVYVTIVCKLFFVSVCKYSYRSSCEKGRNEGIYHAGTREPDRPEVSLQFEINITCLVYNVIYATILAFDVKVERDAQDLADSLGVKIFQADIIYHLFDKFMAYREELKQRKREEFKHIAVFPCKLKVLPQFIFNSRDPIVMGVMIEAGIVKEGTPICVPSRESINANLKQTVRSLPSKETLRGHSDSSFRGEGYIQCCVGVRLCDMYSNQELAEIHFMYGKADGNAALARRLYQERYPQRQCPDRKTFVRLHYRLCEYGKFNSPGLGRGRPRSTTPEVQEEILEAVNMTPSISTRRLALQVTVPHMTVWRLLKEYPYHLQRVQALSPADYPARVRFCQWFLQQCGVNPNFAALVLFTDEAQFTRDGITNFHNQHVWAYENPRATVPSHHQVRFSLNMWAGIIGDRLVDPMYL
ncbi:hypothetical protein ANN_09098 [Periplaneta americana]|uniref:DUF4817 domain-containing protein n=1 Tax=Periplaneta americana TaxID=6978 RepID=A0ABQ8TLD7_PERAM|nr:hypothetical protein ANN_09098 [Periplaneta americana]